MSATHDSGPGRRALITGASGGIGSAIAAALAEEGYALTLAGRDQERLDETAASLPSSARAGIAPGDIADAGYLELLIDHHESEYGRLDMLVNCAGASRPSAIDQIDERLVDLEYQVNLRATILLTRYAVPLLVRTAAAHGPVNVVNVASNAGVRGEAGIASYSAMKGGVVAFTESLHQERSLSGVRATAICPGLTDTALTIRYHDRVPPDGMLSPKDTAEVVRLLTRVSAMCVIPEIVLLRPQEWLER